MACVAFTNTQRGGPITIFCKPAGLSGESIAGLLRFFHSDIDPDESESFFSSTLPFISRLALDLPNLMAQPIPYLRAGSTRSLSLSRVQCGSLLACAFFCIIPAPLQLTRCNELNFSRLYAALAGGGCVFLVFYFFIWRGGEGGAEGGNKKKKKTRK
jgi:hypothetical protein